MNLSKEWHDEKFILGKSDNRMAWRFWDGYREDLLKKTIAMIHMWDNVVQYKNGNKSGFSFLINMVAQVWKKCAMKSRGQVAP